MIPVQQKILHDPDNNQYGDCQRAGIASLLDLSIEEVPHFLHDGDSIKFHTRMNSFLFDRNLVHVETMAIDMEHEQFDKSCSLYHLIYGPSPRFKDTWHCVVGRNGKIVHDPHPDNTGLLDTEGWHFGLLVKACI